MSLAEMKCVPCRGGTPPMEESRARELVKELSLGWELNQAGHLERAYSFKNFAQALELANNNGGRRF